ncbi:WXG100 family type VII secretion target [Plantactinospora sp. B5E13]|uniref:WXG100 family type VII secretion target n=1 Tax=unclassified Plantactinospora TaxID=2631981 RepID=UPI00325DABC5
MPSGMQIVDEGSTVELVKAFGVAYSDQVSALNQANMTQGDLASGWQGQASNTYSAGLDEWKAGLQKVSAALESIRDSMSQFAQLTQSTEDDNIMFAQLQPATMTPVQAGTPATPASWT